MSEETKRYRQDLWEKTLRDLKTPGNFSFFHLCQAQIRYKDNPILNCNGDEPHKEVFKTVWDEIERLEEAFENDHKKAKESQTPQNIILYTKFLFKNYDNPLVDGAIEAWEELNQAMTGGLEWIKNVDDPKLEVKEVDKVVEALDKYVLKYVQYINRPTAADLPKSLPKFSQWFSKKISKKSQQTFKEIINKALKMREDSRKVVIHKMIGSGLRRYVKVISPCFNE